MGYIESIPTYENNIKNRSGKEDRIRINFFSEKLLERLLELPFWCFGLRVAVTAKERNEDTAYIMFLPEYETETVITGHFFYWNIMEVLKIIVEEAEKQRTGVRIEFKYRRFWSVPWDKEGNSKEEEFDLDLRNLKDYEKAEEYIRGSLGITSPEDLMEIARDYERQAKEFRNRCIAAQEVPLNSTIMYDINHNKEVVKLDMKANHYREVARDREKRLEELKGLKKQGEITPLRRRKYEG